MLILWTRSFATLSFVGAPWSLGCDFDLFDTLLFNGSYHLSSGGAQEKHVEPRTAMSLIAVLTKIVNLSKPACIGRATDANIEFAFTANVCDELYFL